MAHEGNILYTDDRVIKKYKPMYYQYNKAFNRKPEAYFLKKYESSCFINLLESNEQQIVMENGGKPIGNRKTITMDLNQQLFITWLDHLSDELSRHKLHHRDINPTNIVYNKKTKTFKLIDFTWAIDPGMHVEKPDVLNPFAENDDKAISKLKKQIKEINMDKPAKKAQLTRSLNLIKKIGVGKYKDGSSIAKGHTYHEIPFDEYKHIKRHKNIGRSEFATIRRTCAVADWSKSSILDIGCSIGCHSFLWATECNAKWVIGTEGDKAVYESAEAIRKYKDVDNLQFINQYTNVDNIPEPPNDRYALVTLMNVFMWIWKQEGPEKAKALLSKIQGMTKRLIFQTSHAESAGMYVIKELKTVAAVQAMLQDAGFARVKHIHNTTAHHGIRSLFYCWN